MLVAIPLLESRVSPRCLFAEIMIVVQIEDGEVVSRDEHLIGGLSDDELLDELVELKVDTLICGGVTREFIEDADMCGIRVINNVAGELDKIMEALKEGRMAPGFGLSKDGDEKAASR
jgi:predicted Fe-Mo cluster-binding NifX family protein